MANLGNDIREKSMRDSKKFKIIFQKNRRFYVPIKREYLEKIKNFRNAQMSVLRQFKPLTEYDQERWFKKISKDPNQILFGILVKKNKNYEFIGYCGLTNIDNRNRRAELSFLVDPKRANVKRTYKADFMATLHIICKYGFEKLNLNKIFAETYSLRKFHISILESFGFRFEGRMREHNFKDGKYCDSLIHSLLYSEWKKIN